MGQPGSQTTRTEPPKYQLPYLQGSLQSAQGLYQNSQQQPLVAPQSGTTTDALRGIETQARAGQPITQAAGSLATNTLNGGFLGSNPYLSQLGQFTGGSNPHLDNTFNQAALQTQNQLASQFAGSGRNIDASQGLRSQQLNDLATNIYGGAYENDRNRALQATGMQSSAYGNERDRQMQTLGMSPQLGQAQYGDLERLLGVGQTAEDYTQRTLDAPGNALDQYIGRISGNMGQTTINTGSQNRGAGALGGALMGAQMGGMFGLPGTVLGGIGGGLLGGWG